MDSNMIYPAQMQTQSFGNLVVNVTNILGFRPIHDAAIRITSVSEPDRIIEETRTDNLGTITPIQLEAPPVENSMEPSSEQPYSQYNIVIDVPGFEGVTISGAEIYPNVTAIQNQSLRPMPNRLGGSNVLYVIEPNTLYGDYPPKIAEEEIKPLDESGEIVLSRVVVPEFVIVHDGPPTDQSAQNHYVRFTDYIKNVASSEIYATWPEATLTANILAILSFTMNRVYTEWYRNRGYNFTITSSTAFDHKWIAGRNLFDNISRIVDQIFVNYISRPNVTQPILTQYCDGKKVSCPNWMTQWGSKSLGDQGYSAIEILRYYYGENIFINTAEEVSGIPSSWPGYDLTIGSSGDKVRQLQNQLNVISNSYPAIPKIAVDGYYGEQTAASVRDFQRIFDMPETGIVDFPTWYKISAIYVAVSRIAELN